MIKNPLRKRLFRELKKDWKKYFVVSLFLILIIGFVSGMYVANGSMLKAAEEGKSKYHLEDGHFELVNKANDDLLNAIKTGNKADIKTYYLNEAKKKVKEEYDKEFKTKFNQEYKEEFDKEFSSSFHKNYQLKIVNQLIKQGLDENNAYLKANEMIKQAKDNGEYQKLYQKTYQEQYQKGYQKAYKEAYDKGYDEVIEEVIKEVNDKYKELEETYELNDTSFQEVQVELYENFYRDENEDYNQDLSKDGTIRLYVKNDDINLACVLLGRYPNNKDEIAIDRMHADNVGINIGDHINIAHQDYKVVGMIAYVHYSTLYEKNTDLMFDAITFDVGMLTQEGFDRLESDIHYNYAWKYQQSPLNENEEKELSDDFMKALVSQTIVYDNELNDYLPQYLNQAIHFASDDMGSDEAMGAVLLNVFIVIIAFIFAITIKHTIQRESSTIGVLLASGYTKKELIIHYMQLPIIIMLFSALVGNGLGYTLFKNVVVQMYYNSYSLPTYTTIFNLEAFYKTTFIPLLLIFMINFIIVTKMMQHTPLQFLRHQLKKNKRKKAIRLPKWSFINRFRTRIIFQNISNYFMIFVGIMFIMVLLAFSIGVPSTLDYYKDHIDNLMFSKYQYVLKDYKDDDHHLIQTNQKNSETISQYSLQMTTDSLLEDISIYGYQEDSLYISIDNKKIENINDVYISKSYQEKYHIKRGDTLVLKEKYENKEYEFHVIGIYDKCQTLAVFLPIDHYHSLFDLDKDQFNMILSNELIHDIDDKYIASIIGEEDILKFCNQLDHSMGSYMTYFQVLCILLSIVLIYLLTKIIIEKNEKSISMIKILGYSDFDIGQLYLFSTTFIVFLSCLICLVLGVKMMEYCWHQILLSYNGWYAFYMIPLGYLKMFLFVFIGYLFVMFLDFHRIQKISMDKALKDNE